MKYGLSSGNRNILLIGILVLVWDGFILLFFLIELYYFHGYFFYNISRNLFSNLFIIAVVGLLTEDTFLKVKSLTPLLTVTVVTGMYEYVVLQIIIFKFPKLCAEHILRSIFRLFALVLVFN